MLSCVAVSRNSKIGPIACTYRAGCIDMFDTCPSWCPFRTTGKCYGRAGFYCWMHWKKVGNMRSDYSDGHILKNFIESLPYYSIIRHHVTGDIMRDGQRDDVDQPYLRVLRKCVPILGTAFTYTHAWIRIRPPKEGECCINASTTSIDEARKSLAKGWPTVLVTDGISSRKWIDDQIRIVHCPAEVSKGYTCANCGGGQGPLCSRIDRDFVISFKMKHGKEVPTR